MFPRHLTETVLAALSDRPVVLLHGARQTGKTTLVRHLAKSEHPARYLTMDDAAVLGAAEADPAGFIGGLEGPVVLDEIQRAPGLFLAIKAVVDRDRSPGRFLLTGSANVLLLPRLSESLAGRMEILTLWPLSQREIEDADGSCVDMLFANRINLRTEAVEDQTDPIPRILRGGYPELVNKGAAGRRDAWFGSYLTTILQRDVRDMANIESLNSLPRLLSLLATRQMTLLNYADLSRTSGLPQTTLKRYLALLEATFLVQVLPAWYANLGKRLAKSPKILLADTGLAAHLLGLDERRMARDRGLLGSLLEGFIAMELRKQIGWSRARPRMYHYRTHDGEEVDLVLELPSGSLVGIEVKAASTVGGGDFKGLRAFASATGKRFHRGVLFYTGSELVPYGDRLHALPVASLWS